MQVSNPRSPVANGSEGTQFTDGAFVPGGWRHKGIIGQQRGDADAVPALGHITGGGTEGYGKAPSPGMEPLEWAARESARKMQCCRRRLA